MSKQPLLVLLIILPLAACNPTNQDTAKIANPASEYCVKHRGGKLTMRTEADGGQVGICVLPDGTEIEEWELYRKDRPEE